MLLWLLLALMTAGALLAILRPLLRAQTAPAEAADAGTMAVYRDQLAEIDADLARGVIDTAEAEAARIEISRRLLSAAEGPAVVTAGRKAKAGAGPSPVLQRLTLGGAGVVPWLALAIYLV